MESRINEKLGILKGDELANYLCSCIPYIREYTETSEKGVQRRDIYDRYLKNVEDDVGIMPSKKSTIKCACGSQHFVIENSDEICIKCGIATSIMTNELSYKEELEMEKNIIYSYERKNHLNEWLAQFQAKETTNVPKDVFDILRGEIKKNKIKNIHDITHSKVKELLKKNSLNKYYDHIPYIATVLNGKKPPIMSQALEEKIRIMFHQTQEPFEKHKPKERKNFLSYPYILYKLCELLSEDEYLHCFPLLKDKDKIYESDQIWRKICNELKWEFIKTAL